MPMNPSATSYIPSFLARGPAQQSGKSSVAATTPGFVPKAATGPDVSPYQPGAPRVPVNVALSPMTAFAHPIAVVNGGSGIASTTAALPTSTADRIRQLYPKKHPEGDAFMDNAANTTATPRPAPPAHSSTPSVGKLGRSGKTTYTREELLALREPALSRVRNGGIVDAPPFLKIPASFAPLLTLPYALEYIDVDSATALVESRAYASPLTGSSSGVEGSGAIAHPAVAAAAAAAPPHPTEAAIREYHCATCAQGGPQPCAPLSEVVRNATKYAISSKCGACLMQSGEVVWGLVQVALVFEARQSSMRMRMMAEKHPNVVRKVTEYLCGEGYHLPLPPITAHDEWRRMSNMLKFDAIRDNRTRVITDLSKNWKKRRTQFEQFVFFFSFRDDRPVRPVKNIITRSVKPGMIAMLTGDVVALVLLHNLGFFVPPDYYWTVYPFLNQSLKEGTLAYDVVRHLGLYFSSCQSPKMFNPIVDPGHRRES